MPAVSPTAAEGTERPRFKSRRQKEQEKQEQERLKQEQEQEQQPPPEEENNQSRRIKNIRGVFTGETPQEQKVIRKKRLEVADAAEPIVLENEPLERYEGVIRASDPGEFQKPVELEKGYAKNLASRFLNRPEEDTSSKKPFVMDLNAEDAVTLESEPVVLEGVVRNADKVEDVIGRGKRGRIKNMAGKFSTGGGNESDGEGGIQQASDGYHTEKPTVQSGKARSMADRFLTQPQEARKNGKPQWMIELENAQDGGVFENEPEVREGVVRADDEQPDVISVQHTRNLKAMWTQFEKEEMSKTNSPKREILVRPKKEPTPEPEPEPEPEPPKNKWGQKRYGRSKADPALDFAKAKEAEQEQKSTQKPALKSTGKRVY